MLTDTTEDGTGRLQQRFKVVKATMPDAAPVCELVNGFAGRGEMLPRTLGELQETIRDFLVVRHGGRVLACVALHVTGDGLAEVRSLAVHEESQAAGLGSLLVQACVAEARSLGLTRVFALTLRPAFFERFGFARADVMTLSRKVWDECYRCPKFPNCDEIAVVLDLTPGSGA
ncbi:MAG: N-acetyltransferase [Dehalococcoidia bacterium]|jgi:amino-acid N-acetyltransferase